MNPPRFDLVITGLLALVVLAAVVAASPDGRAETGIRDDRAQVSVDGSPLSGRPLAGQAGPRHDGAVEAEDAQEASEPQVVDAGIAAQPRGMWAGASMGVTGMAMGLGMATLLLLMMWAMATSWRTRARV